jgi:hypothetical protein
MHKRTNTGGLLVEDYFCTEHNEGRFVKESNFLFGSFELAPDRYSFIFISVGLGPSQ